MNNLITNTYLNQSNLRTSANYNSKNTTGYITDAQGNLYEVVDKNDNNSLDKDAFLKILLTQMQLQDPLSPMDSTESINQMTSFSILEQLTQIGQKLDSLGQILVEMNKTSKDEDGTQTNTNTNTSESDSSSDEANYLLSKLQTIYS